MGMAMDEKWNSVLVDGKAIIGVDPAPTPLSGNSRAVPDQEIHYRKAVQLTLEDETLVFGCVWDGCTFTSDNPVAIASGHWKVHEVTPDLRRVPFGDWKLSEILGRLMDAEDDLKKVIAQRDKAVQSTAPLRKRIKELEHELKDLEAVRKIMAPKK